MLDRLPSSLKVLLIVLTLYLFLVGIGAMSSSFKMMGTDYTQDLLGSRSGPLVSLFIGILATTLVQSSSTSTSVVVGMVAAGAVPFESAVFMIMGANVGTTVTNSLVSLGHIGRKNEYRRAFAAATVHDFFNVFILLFFFPLEVYTGALSWLSTRASVLFQDVGGTRLANPIKALTNPTINAMQEVVLDLGGGGVALLILALCLTFATLIGLVKVLRSLMINRLENLFDRLLFKTPYRSLFFGLFMTVLVQSSSITTSIAVPLVGAGIITIQQVFPYTMGANIGTTATALLAALAAIAAASPEMRETALLGLNLAFFHLIFNVLGVVLVWKIRALPVAIATRFAELAVRNRVIPIAYILFTFYALPFIIILLGK